jgi:hypothetical protein
MKAEIVENELVPSRSNRLMIVKGYGTQSGKSIHPSRYWLPGQTLADISCEMIAVLDNQMISVPMIILGEVLYGSVDLGAGHMSCTHTHRASEDKARAAFGFYLEDSAGGIFMSSKAILHAMH